jgi:hypothetical protein
MAKAMRAALLRTLPAFVLPLLCGCDIAQMPPCTALVAIGTVTFDCNGMSYAKPQ